MSLGHLCYNAKSHPTDQLNLHIMNICSDVGGSLHDK